jgi:hypothetical protein
MNKLLIIGIILAVIAIYLLYNMNIEHTTQLQEKFTQDEIKKLKEHSNKESEELKNKEKEILGNIEKYENNLSKLEDILENDKKTLNSKYTGDKLKENMKNLLDNYTKTEKQIKINIDMLLQKLNKVRGIDR